MEFSSVKSTLFQSKEIRSIPDGWEESIPFRFIKNSIEYDAFLYWYPYNDQCAIKRMIAVSRNDGHIITLSATELAMTFSLNRLVYKIPTIDDYDEFFKDKDRYETLYIELCSSNDDFDSVGKEMYMIFSNLVGDDLLSNLFSLIASNFIKNLSQEV